LLTDVLVYEPKPLPPTHERVTFVLYTEPGANVVTGRTPSEVRIKFSQAVDPATITPESVRLLSGVQKTVLPGTSVRYDPASFTAVIYADGTLGPGRYWVDVTESVHDLRGWNLWDKSYRVPFTVGWFAQTAKFIQ
jgi:hypothetical protein